MSAQEERSLLEQAQGIWQKGFHQLPIHKDLPRLAGGLEIADGHTKRMIYKEQGRPEERAASCLDIIWALAVFFPDFSDQEAIEKMRQALQEEKQNERLASQLERGDTHDEREIFELDDDDDDDEDALPRPDALEEHSSDECPELSSKSHDQSTLTQPVVPPSSHRFSTNAVRSRVSMTGGNVNIFANHLATTWSQYVRTGDLSTQLKQFLESGLIQTDGKLAGILQCIQQEMIMPPVMDLRMNIFDSVPYKDIKGTWYVRVELFFEGGATQTTRSPRLDSLRSTSDLSKSGVFLHNARASSGNIKRRKIPASPSLARSGSRVSLAMSMGSSSGSISPNEMSEEPIPILTPSPKEKSSSPGSRIASAKRFMKRTNSLSGFPEGIKPLSRKESKSRLIPSPSSTHRGKDSEGRRKLKESSPLISPSSKIFRKRGRDRQKESDQSSQEESVFCSPPKEIYIEPLDSGSETEELEWRPIQQVRVLHRKREQSSGDDPNTRIEFEWEFVLTFGADVNQIEAVSLQLIDFYTADGVSKERKEVLLNAFRPYMSEKFPYAHSWKGPAVKLLTKELPRIARVAKVIGLQETLLYEPSRNKSAPSQLIMCLGRTLRMLTPDALSEEELLTIEHSSGPKTAKNLLGAYSTSSQEEGALARLLKATCKDITIPASSQIKKLLQPFCKEVKPVKGTREVLVCFHEHTVRVIHRQSNSCILTEGSDRTLALEWELILVFNGRVDQLLSVSTHLLEFSFSQHVSGVLKTNVLDALAEWIDEETMESTESSIRVADAMRYLSSALSKLPPECETISDPALPEGQISAVNLLGLLSTHLLANDFPPISCHKINQGQSILPVDDRVGSKP